MEGNEIQILINNIITDLDYLKDNIFQYLPISVTCCVCLENSDTKNLINYKIQDIPDAIPDNALFKGPCDKHYICKECLRKIVLNFENNPINDNSAFVYCSYYNTGCYNTDTFLPYYYSHNDIKKILSEEEFTLYINYASRYEYPGYEQIICPNLSCKNKIYIHEEEINDCNYYNTILTCYSGCETSFCYYCREELSLTEKHCEDCYTYGHRENPNCLNYYIVKPTESGNIISESDYLYKQKEITKEIALNYIVEIMTSNYDHIVSIECPICSNKFYKSEQCSSLKHCGVERCYSCGIMQKRYKKNGLGDHWSSIGKDGCPRFDSCTYWNSIAYCDFNCTEGICYNHDTIGDCKIPEHYSGIMNLSNERKQCMVYHFIKSLIKPLRIDLINTMKTKGIELNYYLLQMSLEFVDNNHNYLYYYSPLCFLDDMEIYYNFDDTKIYPWV